MPDLPRDFHALDKRVANWTPPQGPFDPAAAWTMSYARHGLIPERDGEPGGTRAGALTLAFAPSSHKRQLRAVETVTAGFSSPTYTADMDCIVDDLLTPQSWSLAIRWQSGPLAKLRPGEIDQTLAGRLDGSEIVYHAGTRERRRPAPARWTALWNLFAAVQRLPFEASSTLAFDLFEELDLHKPGQRLAYIGPQTVCLGGTDRHLHVFEQTGRGMLPWRWWLDEQHRVLFAAGGRRAYLLESVAKGGAA